MGNERTDKTPPSTPRKPEAETTDQKIDLDAVFRGDESSLAEPGDVDAPRKREQDRH